MDTYRLTCPLACYVLSSPPSQGPEELKEGTEGMGMEGSGHPLQISLNFGHCCHLCEGSVSLESATYLTSSPRHSGQPLSPLARHGPASTALRKYSVCPPAVSSKTPTSSTPQRPYHTCYHLAPRLLETARGCWTLGPKDAQQRALYATLPFLPLCLS